MKFYLIAALAAATSSVKIGEYPIHLGNYSPKADEYSDYHPHVQTYTWDSTGGHPSITATLTIVIGLEVGALIVSCSKSINGWVGTGRVPGIGLDMRVIVTVLIGLWGVVAEVDWVLTDLHGGGSGGKGCSKIELH